MLKNALTAVVNATGNGSPGVPSTIVEDALRAACPIAMVRSGGTPNTNLPDGAPKMTRLLASRKPKTTRNATWEFCTELPVCGGVPAAPTPRPDSIGPELLSTPNEAARGAPAGT